MVKNNNNPRVPPIGGPSPSFDPTPLISSLIGLGTQAISNKQQRKLEAQRRKYDTAQWERQNLYNHPTQQMARLAEAGLNPNMIYGSSPGSAVGNAGAIPAGQAPDYSLTNPVTGYMNTKVAQAQANNMTTSAMKNISQANLTDAETYKLNSLLASQLETAKEGAKQANFTTNKMRLENLAISDEKKGHMAKYLAEVETAMLNRDKAELEQSMYKYRDSMYNAGIKPDDPIQVRAMASVLGLDLSKKLTQEDAKRVLEFLKNPWEALKEYFQNF